MTLFPKTKWGRERLERKRRKKYIRNFRGPWEGYDHAARVRLRACASCGHKETHACHVTARGMGGAKGKWSDLVPLCHSCHLAFDGPCAGRSDLFYLKYEVDLRSLADRLAEAAREENEGWRRK